MSWRTIVSGILEGDQPLVDSLANGAGSIYSQGSLEGAPDDTPFVVVQFLPSGSGPVGTANERCRVWVHDRGGSYVLIDQILNLARKALEGASSNGEYIQTVWEGNSQDLEDSAMETLTRNASFRIAGKE